MSDRSVAFLGAGRMGEALVSGLLRSGGRAPGDLVVTVRRKERAAELAERHGVEATTHDADAAARARIVVLAVKPQDIEALLAEIRPAITPDQLVVSLAAGVRTSFVEAGLAPGVPVVRVMSNVAVLVDEAMSVVAPGASATDADLDAAAELLGCVGRVLRLPEHHLDAVTATSGSGPAYFFLLAEAMIEACILLGLPRDVATELMVQTMLGSAKMLRDTGRHPVELREMVTSPGGTTIAAIRHLEEAGVRAAFLNAMDAARRRSEELARGGGTA
ncbi:MAG: pyrroline-5-carboxylate reductase [Actinomycetota bacterium]